MGGPRLNTHTMSPPGSQSNSSSAGLDSNNSSPSERKSTASPPQVAPQNASVELKQMNKPARRGGSIPLGEDVMQIARIGEVPAMQRLFDEKKFTATHADEEGITPLHVCTT